MSLYENYDPRALGETIRLLRKKSKLNQTELAEAVGIHQTAVSQWEKGRTAPDVLSLRRISELFGLPMESILRGDVEMEPNPEWYSAVKDEVKRRRRRMPILGSVQAGVPVSAVEDIVGYIDIAEEYDLDAHEYFGLRVRGESMQPRLLEGDTVIVRQQPDADTGDVVVALIDGEATVKKLRKTESGVELIPFNPSFDTLVYENERLADGSFRILGKVVEFKGRM